MGFTIQKQEVWTDSYSLVGAHLPFQIVGSNNTGEIQALLELLDYLLRRPSSFAGPISIFTDSQVYDALHKLSSPVMHSELMFMVRTLIVYGCALKRTSKSRATQGSLATRELTRLLKRGVRQLNRIGRHAAQ